MARKEIDTNNPQNIPMTMNDDLYIIVNDNCSWSYSPDPNSVFGAPPTGFLAAGSYTKTTPPTTYGPYRPIATGTVNYEVPHTSDKVAAMMPMAGHSITVT